MNLLTSGEFSSALRQSLIRPILKKPDLDKDIFKNYGPVANIPFLAKVIEKVVAYILGGKSINAFCEICLL